MSKDFRIYDTRIYGLDESILASGFPMKTEGFDIGGKEPTDKDYKRMFEILGSSSAGHGHDCALKGIVVQFNVDYPVYWTTQFQRYHFADVVSSSSFMHRLHTLKLSEHVNKYVEPSIIHTVQSMIDLYNMTKDPTLYKRIVASCPQGAMKTMRVTTNYLQLKTIYNQRKHHKLDEWKVMAQWIEELPYMKTILNKGI